MMFNVQLPRSLKELTLNKMYGMSFAISLTNMIFDTCNMFYISIEHFEDNVMESLSFDTLDELEDSLISNVKHKICYEQISSMTNKFNNTLHDDLNDETHDFIIEHMYSIVDECVADLIEIYKKIINNDKMEIRLLNLNMNYMLLERYDISKNPYWNG